MYKTKQIIIHYKMIKKMRQGLCVIYLVEYLVLMCSTIVF